MFVGKQFLVAGHEELCPTGLSQCEEITVLGVRRDGLRVQIPDRVGFDKEREITKSCCEQLGFTGAKSSSEKRPLGDLPKFRDELITSNEGELLPLPGVQQPRRRTLRREKCREQYVGIKDDAHHRRCARSR